jgi:FKBP-type peptidyl-prolyl cis-trans isomerase FklB
MNKFSFFVLMSCAFAAFAQKTTTKTTSTSTSTSTTTVSSSGAKLETKADTIGYIIGVQVGNQIGESAVDKPSLFGLNMGFADAYSKKDYLIPKAQFQTLLQNFFEEQQALVIKEKAESNKKFLDENAKKAGVTTTGSGLQYEVVKLGTGAKPQATDVVKVFYKGTHLDGKEFDGNMGGEPITFPLNQVIAGWTEGLQLMPAGSTYRFYIPAHLAYGEQGSPPVIGANEVLIFDVELLGIENPAPQPTPLPVEPAPHDHSDPNHQH